MKLFLNINLLKVTNFFLLSLALFACSNSSQNEVSNEDADPAIYEQMDWDSEGLGIIGGQDAKEPAFFARLVTRPDTDHFCGGSFVRWNVIVTAAHCVLDLSASEMIVRKKGRISGKNHDYIVKGIKVHPQFNAENFTNDIALVFIDMPKDPNLGHYSLIGVNNDASLPEEAEDSTVEAAGYGNTSNFGSKFLDTIQHAEIPVVPLASCKDMYSKLSINVVDSQLCAGDTEKGGVDTCQGDSGGPLYVSDAQNKPQLVGIVSFGQGCADKRYPGVYTRVSSFSNWINQEASVPPSGKMAQALKQKIPNKLGDDTVLSLLISGASKDSKEGKLLVKNQAVYPVFNWELTCNASYSLEDAAGRVFAAVALGNGTYQIDFAKDNSLKTLRSGSSLAFELTIPASDSNTVGSMSCRINTVKVPASFMEVH